MQRKKKADDDEKKAIKRRREAMSRGHGGETAAIVPHRLPWWSFTGVTKVSEYKSVADMTSVDIDYSAPFLVKHCSDLKTATNDPVAKSMAGQFRAQLPTSMQVQTNKKAQAGVLAAVGSTVGRLMKTFVPKAVALDMPPVVGQWGAKSDMCQWGFEYHSLGSLRYTSEGCRELVMMSYSDAFACLDKLSKDRCEPNRTSNIIRIVELACDSQMVQSFRLSSADSSSLLASSLQSTVYRGAFLAE